MWKLFLKAFFFITGIVLLLNLLGTLADRVAPSDDWRMDFVQAYTNLKVRNEQVKAVTLGNSHGGAIDYSAMGIEGHNLSFAAADLFEIEKTVSSLGNKLPNLNIVFITISPYHFSRDNARFDALKSRRIRFYSILPIWSPIEGDLSNFLMGKLDAYTHVMSVVRSDHWQGVWPALIPNGPAADPFPYDGVYSFSEWGACYHYTAEQLDVHAREIAERNVTSSLQMAAAHPGIERDSYNALARTIEHLQARGVRVILYMPAYYDRYNVYFSEGGSSILDHTRLAIERLQNSYGVEYYDFSDDPNITVSPELFYNSDHLNDCGSRVMSEKLREQIGGDSAFGQ